MFHDTQVALPLPLPAGAALASPWLDLTQSMPSITANAKYDYLPPPLTEAKIAAFPHDSIWPTDPPRRDVYCDASMMCHPLVSPLAAKDWSGACPIWFGEGEEMLTDEAKCLAAKIKGQGGKVVWRMWGGGCHCFGLVLAGFAEGRMFFEEWVAFIKSVGEGKEVESNGKFFEAKTLRDVGVDVEGLAVLGDEEVRRRMNDSREVRERGGGGDGRGRVMAKL